MKRILHFKALWVLSVLLLSSSISFSQVTQLWVKTYNGPGNTDDRSKAVGVDKSGNVYVTGVSGSDYLTIKYNANGDTIWTRRYNGPGNGEDVPVAVAVDAAGNVYVTGRSSGSNSGMDYATIKYDTNGDRLWVKRYNGPGNGDDEPSSIALDAIGNVHITGRASNGQNSDYATIKYDTNGNQLWVKRYNGPGNNFDRANAIAVDENGNVYVTGLSRGVDTEGDYATVKYSVTGDQVWVARYAYSWEDTWNDETYIYNADEEAFALALDSKGNVIVTGISSDALYATIYATIKYNNNGDQLWAERSISTAFLYFGIDFRNSLAVDPVGNVYVSEGVYQYSGECYGQTDSGPKFSVLDSGPEFFIFRKRLRKLSSDGQELWVKPYGISATMINALAVDAAGYVYIADGSYVDCETSATWAVYKFDSEGNQVFLQPYAGIPAGLVVDATGNVYVTGFSYTDDEHLFDYLTIKYSQKHIAGFTLVNADTDKDLFALQDGDTSTFLLCLQCG